MVCVRMVQRRMVDHPPGLAKDVHVVNLGQTALIAVHGSKLAHVSVCPAVTVAFVTMKWSISCIAVNVQLVGKGSL